MLPQGKYSQEAMAARAEITDRISLYAHALDRRRWELFEQVFHEDATWQLSSFAGGWRETLEAARRVFEEALDVTHHQVGNVLMTIDGDEAFAETYLTAYHRVRADAPANGMFAGTGSQYDLIAGMRYHDRFERRSGQWRIATRTATHEWRHLQPAADGTLPTLPSRFRGRQDGRDPSWPAVAGFHPV